MVLSDISITRPVLAVVMSLLLVIFGIITFKELSLRELPDIDPPIVTISVNYPGAAANVVETRITKLIEERIAGVEGIQFIDSRSMDGEARITLEFDLKRDIDDATNDVRDRVARMLDNLPEEADPPEVQKTDSSDEVAVWLSLSSDAHGMPELTDYAERILVDRFSIINGVSRVRISGQQSYAMRVWLDRQALAARGLTANDVETALQAENVELPAGNVESASRQFTVRVDRAFRSADDFRNLVLGKGRDGYLVRLGDVARVERGLVENRTFYRGNGIARVGLGVVKQSKANTIDVAKNAISTMNQMQDTLPKGMVLSVSYDTSVFVSEAIHEVYITLGAALLLVVLVIYAFLGNIRATIIPALAVPISILSTFIVLFMFGYTINMLTLLGLVLAIGLVVDDAIIVLENIVRRMDSLKETPLVAAWRGTRQVAFAVIATTLVLIAVFVPITFLEGDVGRLFTEFSVTMAAAVAFSGFVALSLSPMLASQVLKPQQNDASTPNLKTKIDNAYAKVQGLYSRTLDWSLRHSKTVVLGFAAIIAVSGLLFYVTPSEYAPREDRGVLFINVNAPEGSSFEYTKTYMDEIERRLLPYLETGEASTILVRAPRDFGNAASFSGGAVVFIMSDWSQRKNGFQILADVRAKLADLPGVTAFPVMRQGFGGGSAKPVQFVIGGPTYEELAAWRDILLEKLNGPDSIVTSVDWDYKETKPQFRIRIDYSRAAELGVNVRDIGRTLETMLGGRRVTTYIEDGEEYDVMLEGERAQQSTPGNIDNIYVRSSRTQTLVPLSNLVKIDDYADSRSLNRYNRVRAITIEADMKDGYTLGQGLNYLEDMVRAELPETAVIDYKGQSQDLRESGGSVLFVFLMGIFIVYLVLAAQFESFIHPFVIILTVPLAMIGGLLGLYLTGSSLNIYSQIGLIVLVGIATKNGILIVEFANQLREEGQKVADALRNAAALRLRPILMTSITAVMGALPLVIRGGAGSETRMTIGTVIIFGITTATIFTLYIVPSAYQLLTSRTRARNAVTQQLEAELAATPDRPDTGHH